MRVHKRQRGGAWGPQRFLAAAGRCGARRARPQCLMTSLQTHSLQTRRGRAAPRRAVAARPRRRLLSPPAPGRWAICGQHLYTHAPPAAAARLILTSLLTPNPHSRPRVQPRSPPPLPHSAPPLTLGLTPQQAEKADARRGHGDRRVAQLRRPAQPARGHGAP